MNESSGFEKVITVSNFEIQNKLYINIRFNFDINIIFKFEAILKFDSIDCCVEYKSKNVKKFRRIN